MKKFIIATIISVVLIVPVFADSALSGHVQSQVVYDFSEPENQTLKYNIKGSLASFTVDFTNLSFSKKGEKKPYVDISASAALQFNVGDHDIEWATYVFPIGQTDVVGVIKLNKFNLVADVAGKELVVDFLHNNVGGDWAKSPYTKFKYTTVDDATESSAWNSNNVQEAAFTYNNKILEYARLRPGFTITYGGWSTGASFDLTFGGENEYGFFTLGTETPDFKIWDNSHLKAALAVKFDVAKTSHTTRESLIGGSLKGGYESDDFAFSFSSDYGMKIDTVVEDKETEFEFDGIDFFGNIRAYIANLGVYYTTRTPIIGHKIETFGLLFSDPDIDSLMEINNVLSAKLVLDFHKLSSPVPLTISALALDVLYKQDDPERDDPYSIVEEGLDSFYHYANFKAISRYGRDLDVEVSTDAFVKQHISLIWAFGRRLLQTKELGAGIEFTFGDLKFGDVVSWTIDTKMLWDKLFIEYAPEQFRVYAAAQFYKSFSNEDPLEFTAIAGISSDKIVEIATVGAEFRYKMSDYETESVFADSCKDFTIYCKVEF